jgi:hypothetical protein
VLGEKKKHLFPMSQRLSAGGKITADSHNIIKILLKVALNTITLTLLNICKNL